MNTFSKHSELISIEHDNQCPLPLAGCRPCTSNFQQSPPWIILSSSFQLSCDSFMSFSIYLLHVSHGLPLWVLRQYLMSDILTRFPEGVPNPSQFPRTNFLLISDSFSKFFITNSVLPFDFQDTCKAAIDESPDYLPYHFGFCFPFFSLIEEH